MIDGISSTGVQQTGMHSFNPKNVQLTDDQKAQLSEILAKYDPSSMTEDDKKALMEELKSSGIPPAKEVMTMMEDAGFEIGPPPEGPPPSDGRMGPPPKPEFIEEAITKYENGELTEEDIEKLMAKLKDMGEPTQGILFDTTS